jgi:RND family efflux transporter MFP subunit
MYLSRITTGLVATTLVLLAGCSSKKAKPRLGEVERLPSLETVHPQFTAEQVKIEVLATVEPFETADLSSQVMGEVKGLADSMDIDYPISKGQTLLTLDVPALRAELASKDAFRKQARNLLEQVKRARDVAEREVTEAKARRRRFEAELAYRDRLLKRVGVLVKRDTVSKQLQDESVMQRDAARSGLEEAKAQVQTKAAKLEAAKAEVQVASSRVQVAEADFRLVRAKVEFATLKAPFDGVVVKRWVHNGTIIKDPAMPLLTVARTDILRVLIDIPERYVPLVRAGQGSSARGRGTPVELLFTAFSKTYRPVGKVARITRVAPSLDNVTRTLRAEIHLKNPKSKSGQDEIRPGMTGKAVVLLDNGSTKKLTIPSTALVRVGKEIRVYYIANPKGSPPRGLVKSTVVALGLDNGKVVEIKSGLPKKDPHKLWVIAKGNGVLPEGSAIAVKLRESKH